MPNSNMYVENRTHELTEDLNVSSEREMQRPHVEGTLACDFLYLWFLVCLAQLVFVNGWHVDRKLS